MNTLGQRPSASKVVKSSPVEGYIPLEPSFWQRHAALIWTMIIFLFIVIGTGRFNIAGVRIGLLN